MQSKNTLVNNTCCDEAILEGYWNLFGMVIRQAILDFLSKDLLAEPEAIEENSAGHRVWILEHGIIKRRESIAFFTNKQSLFQFANLDAASLISQMIDVILETEKSKKYIEFLKWQKEMLKNKDWYKIDPPNVQWFEKVYIPENAHKYWNLMKGVKHGKEEESETHQRILEEAKRTFKDKEVLRNISGLLEKTGGKDW